MAPSRPHVFRSVVYNPATAEWSSGEEKSDVVQSTNRYDKVDEGGEGARLGTKGKCRGQVGCSHPSFPFNLRGALYCRAYGLRDAKPRWCCARRARRDTHLVYISLLRKPTEYGETTTPWRRELHAHATHCGAAAKWAIDPSEEELRVFLQARGQTFKHTMPLAMHNLAIALQRDIERYCTIRGSGWDRPKASFAPGDHVLLQQETKNTLRPPA